MQMWHSYVRKMTPADRKNFRPVSVLASLSKVFETDYL